MTATEGFTELRNKAYTTPRTDVFAMVPSTAMSILDVGCSNGALGASLRHACQGRQVVGLEMDPVFAHEAQTQLDHVICADVSELIWSEFMPGVTFDCIVFADVLEHLMHPEKVLQEAQRRLRPNGCIVISLPNIRHLSSFYSIFLKGTFPLRNRGIFDKTHLRWFTIRDAKTLIAGTGMTVDRASYVLRVGDQGGGILNRIVNKVLGPFQQFFLIREFLTYQFCIRAVSVK